MPCICSEPPSSVQRLTLATDGVTGDITVTWSPPSNLTVPLVAYNLTYQVIGVGDCNDTYQEAVVSQSLDASLTSYRVEDVEPWRTYRVTLSATNVAGEGSITEEIIASKEIGEQAFLEVDPH